MVSIFKGKRGFAFTFLAFFLAIILFAFIYLNFTGDVYTKRSVFNDARISAVNSELKYFKQTYLPNILSYSFYNTMDAFLVYVNSSSVVYSSVNNNYERLNSLILEGMLNASFDGINQPLLNSVGFNKTITYFVSSYAKNFYDTYKGNISINVLDINVFEKNPYYISVVVYCEVNVSLVDNLSSWGFTDTLEVSVPVYDMPDPRFLVYDGQSIPIRASEFYFPAQNWTYDRFKEVVNETYSTVYFDSNYKYSLGDSFLKRLLNITRGSYGNVSAFWSFDYDEEEKGVYDTSLNSGLGRLYGNSKLLLGFNDGTVSVSEIGDSSAYQNNGTPHNGVNCLSLQGVLGNSCVFDGVNDYISISDTPQLNFSGSFAVSFWFKNLGEGPNNRDYGTLITKNNGNFAVRDTFSCFLSNHTAKLGCRFGNSTYDYTLYSVDNFTSLRWNHVVFDYDLAERQVSLYVNGILNDEVNFSSSWDLYEDNSDIFVGSWPANGTFFNGSMDEVAIYTKALSTGEVAKLYDKRQVLSLDYVDAFHDLGVLFDGKDDFVNLSGSLDLSDFTGDWSYEIWFSIADNISRKTVLSKDRPVMFEVVGNRIYAHNYISAIGWENVSYGPLVVDKEYYVAVVWDSPLQTSNLYLNGVLVNSSNMGGSIGGGVDDELLLGQDSVSFFSGGNFFHGVIDEVKFYSVGLDSAFVRSSFYDYDSLGKGCCNYITLMNPNRLGYNTTAYSDNVSYSSRVFYNWYKNNDKQKIILYNITGITAYDTNDYFYHFLVDRCIAKVYDVFSYKNSTIDVEYHDATATLGVDCMDLIKMGVY